MVPFLFWLNVVLFQLFPDFLKLVAFGFAAARLNVREGSPFFANDVAPGLVRFEPEFHEQVEQVFKGEIVVALARHQFFVNFIGLAHGSKDSAF